MARRIPDEALRGIEQAVQAHAEGASLGDIAAALTTRVPPRTLQYRLKHPVDEGRLVKKGEGRGAKYRLATKAPAAVGGAPLAAEGEEVVPLSPVSLEIRRYLGEPTAARRPVGYNREFLDSYKPNITAYLSAAERSHLAEVGNPNFADQAAGTYAKQILNRLLIDLSWNSSRLEGNTYSLLDTKRLIEFGEEAEGHRRLEAQMIVNHKDAIAFLVSAAEEIGFNRYTVLNLHGILAHNLLPDEAAAGA